MYLTITLSNDWMTLLNSGSTKQRWSLYSNPDGAAGAGDQTQPGFFMPTDGVGCAVADEKLFCFFFKNQHLFFSHCFQAKLVTNETNTLSPLEPMEDI